MRWATTNKKAVSRFKGSFNRTAKITVKIDTDVGAVIGGRKVMPSHIQGCHWILSTINVKCVVPNVVYLKIEILVGGRTGKTKDAGPCIEGRRVRLHPTSDGTGNRTLDTSNTNINIVIHTVKVQGLSTVGQWAFNPGDPDHGSLKFTGVSPL